MRRRRVDNGFMAHALAPAPFALPDSKDVGAVSEKVAAALRKLDSKRNGEPAPVVELSAIGYGLISTGATTTSGRTWNVGLVRCEDWTPVGHLCARIRKQGPALLGAVCAGLVDGRLFQSFCGENDPHCHHLFVDGRAVGRWVESEFTYDGHFREPLRRELFAGDQLFGTLESDLLKSGCAVLECVDGSLIPMRSREVGLICGNPLKEVLKATPLGRKMGPREPNLDTVLTRHGAARNDAELPLLFSAALTLRAVFAGLRASSD
jgi:hypothetical protein